MVTRSISAESRPAHLGRGTRRFVVLNAFDRINETFPPRASFREKIISVIPRIVMPFEFPHASARGTQRTSACLASDESNRRVPHMYAGVSVVYHHIQNGNANQQLATHCVRCQASVGRQSTSRLSRHHHDISTRLPLFVRHHKPTAPHHRPLRYGEGFGLGARCPRQPCPKQKQPSASQQPA